MTPERYRELVDDVPDDERAVCLVCGCSNAAPCPGGCVWAAEDLCSRCLREELAELEGSEP
jgi:hypothetical protein